MFQFYSWACFVYDPFSTGWNWGFHPTPGVTDACKSGEPGLRDSTGPLEMSSVVGTGRTLGNGLQKESGLDRWFQHGLGSSVRRPTSFRLVVEGCLHINCLEILAVCRALHAFLPDLKGHHVLVRLDSMTVVANINHQGGPSSRRLFTLVERLMEWAQHNLCSLRATHMAE